MDNKGLQARWGKTVKGVIELNANYYLSLLSLSQDYVRSLAEVARAGLDHSVNIQPVTEPEQPPLQPPILFAALTGETATGSFVVSNSLGRTVDMSIDVTGDVDPGRFSINPKQCPMQAGENALIDISIDIDEGFENGRDYHGAFSVRNLSTQEIPFVLRRLQDDQVPPPDEYE